MYLLFWSLHFWCVAQNAFGEEQGSETLDALAELTFHACNFAFSVN